jgi:hypothetical protein
MRNGVPDSKNVIHYQEIYPDNITTSLYGTTATNIVLDKPVFIPAMTEFFISIGSKSTEYTVFVAQLGENDLSTNQIVMKNPYQDGVLFTSSNGITWSAVQEKDLAIKLYEGTFAETGSFITENISFPQSTWTGFGRFILYNNVRETPYSKAQFYYTIDDGTTWYTFNPGDEINVDSAAAEFKIKCEFTGNGTTTPIVDYESNLIFFKYDVTQIGQYRTFETDDVPAYNNIKIIVDENQAAGTNIIHEFCIETAAANNIWFRMVQDAVDEVDIGKGFSKNTYEFDFDLLQKLTVSSVSGFAVGDDVKYTGAPADTAKITAIDTTNKFIWIILNDDGETRFTDSHELTNGTTTIAIDTVTDYTSEPSWPTIWTGRILVESVNYWKTPCIMNYRSIMKAV